MKYRLQRNTEGKDFREKFMHLGVRDGDSPVIKIIYYEENDGEDSPVVILGRVVISAYRDEEGVCVDVRKIENSNLIEVIKRNFPNAREIKLNTAFS
ncbi:MAG TPA: hypothetical protein VJJ21_02140 [Candidatus Nanoarchaeia archaeon]|nr:hypothetical protein [Candidatus Nanoarchaeia archaeon]